VVLSAPSVISADLVITSQVEFTDSGQGPSTIEGTLIVANTSNFSAGGINFLSSGYNKTASRTGRLTVTGGFAQLGGYWKLTINSSSDLSTPFLQASAVDIVDVDLQVDMKVDGQQLLIQSTGGNSSIAFRNVTIRAANQMKLEFANNGSVYIVCHECDGTHQEEASWFWQEHRYIYVITASGVVALGILLAIGVWYRRKARSGYQQIAMPTHHSYEYKL